MLEIVRGTLNSNTMKLRAKTNSIFFLYCSIANSHFCYCSTVVIQCCTSEEKWKQVMRFFIEYGTVAILEERTEQSYARSVTDLSYENNLHDRCRLLA